MSKESDEHIYFLGRKTRKRGHGRRSNPDDGSDTICAEARHSVDQRRNCRRRTVPLGAVAHLTMLNVDNSALTFGRSECVQIYFGRLTLKLQHGWRVLRFDVDHASRRIDGRSTPICTATVARHFNGVAKAWWREQSLIARA